MHLLNLYYIISFLLKKRIFRFFGTPVFSHLSLFHCKGHAVCTLVFCRVHFMCAYLNGIQCAVIFCAVVVSALFHCTFDTFITFFHVRFPPQIWYRDSMCRFSEIITAYFSFFKFYDILIPKGGEPPMAEKKTTAKKTTVKKPTSITKKLSVTLDKETYSLLEEYIAEFGFSKDEFVKKAIMEKISRDKISSMIDDMIRL